MELDRGMELVWIAVGGVALVLIALAVHLYRKSRPLAGVHVFVASRWSRGNHLFPTQVAVSPTTVVHYTPHWIGHLEHSINIAHVASVRVDTRLIFADVFIETTGGHSAIHCLGHRKKDALEIKRLIEEFQTAYYRESIASSGARPPE
jgi:hypothetical protein